VPNLGGGAWYVWYSDLVGRSDVLVRKSLAFGRYLYYWGLYSRGVAWGDHKVTFGISKLWVMVD
jgi:hypothetical protein